ncbi:HNH endonuclease [Pseudoroseomonas cervicalis]|uniref:HNH endonuclease n=1 Tax=Teichococcus cervicalis TaxID=204525 RepID=UPI00278215E6|nr:HNH endonuclease signature motif containing protein [Pseudoroseomonas cervicalis]MDQ1077995.1 5-methylcytosine-specific restriction protein A [Pseudoroseomonas cervicalis]
MPVKPPVHRPPHHNPTETRREQLSALDRRRGSSASRGYDGAWQRLRLQVLSDEPLCRFCHQAGRIVAATEVDHIQPIALRPDLRLARANLRSLCKPCHSRLTASGVQTQGFSE